MSDNGNDTLLLTSLLASPGTNCCPCRHFVFLVTDIRDREEINGTYLFLTTLTKGFSAGKQWHFPGCWDPRPWTDWSSHSAKSAWHLIESEYGESILSSIRAGVVRQQECCGHQSSELLSSFQTTVLSLVFGPPRRPGLIIRSSSNFQISKAKQSENSFHSFRVTLRQCVRNFGCKQWGSSRVSID